MYHKSTKTSLTIAVWMKQKKRLIYFFFQYGLNIVLDKIHYIIMTIYVFADSGAGAIDFTNW